MVQEKHLEMGDSQCRAVGDLSGKDQTRDNDKRNTDAPEGIAPIVLDLHF